MALVSCPARLLPASPLYCKVVITNWCSLVLLPAVWRRICCWTHPGHGACWPPACSCWWGPSCWGEGHSGGSSSCINSRHSAGAVLSVDIVTVQYLHLSTISNLCQQVVSSICSPPPVTATPRQDSKSSFMSVLTRWLVLFSAIYSENSVILQNVGAQVEDGV